MAWWALAALFVLVATGSTSDGNLLALLAAAFLLTALIAAVGSRLAHLSWILFAAVGAIALLAALV